MNKFSQWVITICVIIITVFSILAYLEAKKIKNSSDLILSTQTHIDNKVNDIDDKLFYIQSDVSAIWIDTRYD